MVGWVPVAPACLPTGQGNTLQHLSLSHFGRCLGIRVASSATWIPPPKAHGVHSSLGTDEAQDKWAEQTGSPQKESMVRES